MLAKEVIVLFVFICVHAKLLFIIGSKVFDYELLQMIYKIYHAIADKQGKFLKKPYFNLKPVLYMYIKLLD